MTRRLRPGRNPLRRTADRAEAAVMAALLVVFLAVVPLAALAAAGWAAAGGMRAERVQALSQASLEPLVRARWTAPGGAPREGEVYAPGGARAGTAVMVWTDGSGRLEPAPVQRADVAAQEALAALMAAILAAAAVAGTGFFARRVLDRRRLAAWDADWSGTGPQWTGRL